MTKFSKRLKELRQSKKLSQDELGKLLGTTRQSISNYENSKREPDYRTAEELSDIFNVDLNYLLGLSDKTTKISQNYEEDFDDAFSYDYIPDGIAAGLPMSVDGITEFEKVTISDIFLGKYARNKNIKISYASGESMNNIIPNGSLIAFLTNINIQNLKDGDIVIFRDNYEYSIKHFYRTDKMLIFRPDSTDKAFTDIIYNIEDIEEINIIGKLVAYNIILN